MSSGILCLSNGFTRLIPSDPRRAVVHCSETSRRQEDLEREVRQVREEAERLRLAERKKVEALWQLLESRFDACMSDVEVKIREQLIELSMRMAEIILRRQLPDRDMIRDVILETVEPVSDLQGAKVRLHPDDAAVLLAAREERAVSANSLPSKLEIVADRDLAPGDVQVESRNGYFDARLSERIELLRERLMERERDWGHRPQDEDA